MQFSLFSKGGQSIVLNQNWNLTGVTEQSLLVSKVYYLGSTGCRSGTRKHKVVTRVTYWTSWYIQDEMTSSDSDMVGKHRF